MSLIKPFGSKQASKISPVLFSFISLFPSSEFGHKIRRALLNLVYDYRLNAADGSKITNKRRPRINAAPNQKNAAFTPG